MHTICYDLFHNILYCVAYTTYSHNFYFSFNDIKQFMCRDMNENVKYRQKCPERTTSISVTMKLLISIENIYEIIH